MDISNNNTAENNRLYYNEIANSYDAILADDDNNRAIRNIVREKFTSIINEGEVLDFGGGTGLDLDWLLAHKYQVVFCEPSEKMRGKAKDRHQNNSPVVFLDNAQTDFADWHRQQPFLIKRDAVLSDFAVFNCIENIDLLFKNLSSVLKSHGHLIVLMLKYGDQKSLYWKLKEYFKSAILQKPLLINTNYEKHKQIVYVYSLREIKKASFPYFNIKTCERVNGFNLFHFVKNE